MISTWIGIDIGGTFTDWVAVGRDAITFGKVPSTPDDPSVGVADALGAAGVAGEFSVAHGMTVATNTLLERSGARTALITTEGFRDIIEIGRQNRPSLYDLADAKPEPLVPRELRFTVKERVGPDGIVEPLDAASVDRVVDAVRDADVEAVAICLLFAFVDPSHERRVAAALRERLPDLHVSLSSEVLPEFREFERTSSVVADAYLRPRMAGYLDRLVRRVESHGTDAPLIMRSSGGVTNIAGAIAKPASCVMSGPAAGAVGAAYVARRSGFESVLTLDMGGTSADVASIIDGQISVTTNASVAGVPIGLPMLDVHTISAGGGSIVSADGGRVLKIGPQSAGAKPGPACYGRGGELPTVTDAIAALGLLGDGAMLGGTVRIDAERALRSFAPIAETTGLDLIEVASGVREVVDMSLAQALRVISVERGRDPRDCALVSFGGAGGLHACNAAERLGVTTVLVPRGAGVLSAFGLAISDLRADASITLLQPLETIDRDELEARFAELERRASEEFSPAGITRLMDLRYRRQAFELTLDAVPIDTLAERFHDAHEQRYGFRNAGAPIDVVNLRVVATAPRSAGVDGTLGSPRPAVERLRRVNLGAGWVEIPVLRQAELGHGSQVSGPAIIEFDDSTCLVPDGWAGAVDAHGTLVLGHLG